MKAGLFGGGWEAHADELGLAQLGPDGPRSAAMLSMQLPPRAVPNFPSTTQRPEKENVGASGGILGTLHDIYRGAADAVTKPEVTDFIKRQGGYIDKTGDLIGLAGRGVAVAGAATLQPELIGAGGLGIGTGEGLNLLGNGLTVLSDVLANNRNQAVKDAVRAGVAGVTPPTVDTRPWADKLSGYFGY